MALAHPLHPITSRSRNTRRNLWVGWYVSFWRPWFWSVYSIYYIHTIYQGALYVIEISSFLETYIPKVSVAMMVYWMIWYCYSFLFGFKCAFQLHSSGFPISWYGYKYHVTLSIGELLSITVYRAVFWVCAVLVLSVNMSSFCYLFDRVLFHHGFIMIVWLLLGFLWPFFSFWTTL